MQNLLNWALPIFRAFGIQVRVHILFFIVTLGLFLRQVTQPDNIVWWGDVFLFSVFLLFVIILLHEYGHCFGGRNVGGEAENILIWPLGGLAFVDVPKEWKAHTFTAFAGPLVNIVLCFVSGVILAVAGYIPTFNPVANPYLCEVTNYRDGHHYTSEYGLRVYNPATGEEVSTADYRKFFPDQNKVNEEILKHGHVRAQLDWWYIWTNRLFWLSWVLLLFNLIPAYPLDGGQILQGLLWSKLGYRQATTVAAYVGLGCAVLFLVAAIATNESLLMGLGFFMLVACMMKLRELEMEDPFLSDYYSDDAENAKPKPKRIGPIKRWLLARAARRAQREAEQRAQDDERMDQLLDKIQQTGKESLTPEERRFMERVSARYRNK